jgi:bifunctional DNase/RNase
VFLGNDGKIIAIFVDHSVAAAITMFLHGIKKPRPLTHDLIANVFAGLGAKVQKVVVNDLREDTFYARLYVLQENELGRNLVEIDARPSDSIAIALQQGCPIFVGADVWARAEDMSWALKQASESQDTKDEGEDEKGKNPEGS